VPRPKTVSDAAILAAAWQVIGRVGPGRLTLGAVADAADLAPATLIQRFGSKRRLLLELHRASAQLVSKQWRPSAGASALETLVDNLIALAAPFSDPVAFSNHLAVLHQDLSDPEFHASARMHLRAVRAEVEALLFRALDTGELSASVDVHQLARSMQSTYNGALITWAIERDGPLEPWLRRDLEAILAPRRGRDTHPGLRTEDEKTTERTEDEKTED
jgi:AcrR family transcriptional regulator